MGLKGAEQVMPEHVHNFRIFLDDVQRNQGWLVFYCQSCLQLVRVKKEYAEGLVEH